MTVTRMTIPRSESCRTSRTPPSRGGRRYKVRWKGFATLRDLWQLLRGFVPRYTTVWLDYLKKKEISLDVKDVFGHLNLHERD